MSSRSGYPFLFLALLLALACDEQAGGLSAGGAIVLTSDLPGARFGASGDLLSDANGDGFDDLAVGAPGDPTNGVDAGSVSIHFGGASGPRPDADRRIVGKPGDRFGLSVADLGDLNGDGFGDLAVTTRRVAGLGIVDRSAVLIFLGSSTGPAVREAAEADIAIAHRRSAELRVASAGDLDWSGRPDLAVADPAAGEVYVFLNGTQIPNVERFGTAQADLTLTSAAGSELGYALGAVGDVSADYRLPAGAGRFGDDLAVGAPGLNGRGAAFVLLGNPGVPRGRRAVETVALRFDGAAAGDRFGASVAGVGDFDVDLAGDLAVGVPGNGVGRVEIFFGRAAAGPTSRTPMTLTGEAPGDAFGTSASGFLPFGLAGVPSVGIGSPLNPFSGPGTGSAYLVSKNVVAQGAARGAVLNALSADRILRNPLGAAGGRAGFGALVRAGLDLNGDGEGDLLITAPDAQTGGVSAGAALVAW